MPPQYSSRRKAVAILILMLITPLTAADISSWSGPNIVGSTGNTRIVDGWSVPGNATILDGWLNIESGNFPSTGNGTNWDGRTSSANFSSGGFSQSTFTHFNELLTLSTNGSFGNIDHFNSPPALSFAQGISTGGNGVTWLPTDLNYSGTPAANGGNTITNGTIPANMTEGQFAVGTNPGSGVPAGSNSWLKATPLTIPSPISNFTLEFDQWYHLFTNANSNGDMDGVWVEYRLDNGNWTWMEPVGGYNNTISPNAPLPSGANRTGNGSHGFPVWAKVAYSGWEHPVFELDNLTGINNATTIDFRFRIWTDANSTVRPGWYFDNITIQNIGAGQPYWHHGCFVSNGTCGYSASSYGALQVAPLNLSSTSGNPILKTEIEWDLEGSQWDNFCVEMSLNNTTWEDISSGSNSTNQSCSSRTSPIPGNGYTLGNVTLGDESGGIVTLNLTIPTTYVGQNPVYLRYVVEADSIINNGGTMDNQEGVTIDRIRILSSAGANAVTHYDNPLSSIGSAFHYTAAHATNTVDDWSFMVIGVGGLTENYGFEDSIQMPPGGWTVVNNGTSPDSWDFGAMPATTTAGPGAWLSGNYGFGTVMASQYTNNMNAELFTPTYSIPAGASARLVFESWICAEDNWDGGTVHISVNGGPFTHFDPTITQAGQTTTWYDGTASALGGEDVFNGQPAGNGCGSATTTWQSKSGNLTQYQGNSLQFKFIFATDSSVTMDGWYLDDMGVEVDYFEQTGSWLSPAISLDDLGNGFLDVAATTPNGTFVSGSITDTAGNPLDGYDNLTLPISLAGIDRDTYPAVKVQINLGTNNPFITPMVKHVHVGALRYFAGGDATNGWDIDSGLTLTNGNWSNPTQTPLTIVAPFVTSTNPIKEVNISGSGNGVTASLIDSKGNFVGSNGLGNLFSFPEAEPGYGVRFSIAPNGELLNALATGSFGQPTLNPAIDVTDDGTVDWRFTRQPNLGYFGWQAYIHSINGIATPSLTTTATINATSGGVGVDVLIPEGATVSSGVVAFQPDSSTTGSLDVTVGGIQAIPYSAGLNSITYLPIDASMIAAANNLPNTHTDSSSGRNWRMLNINFSSTTSEVINVLSVSLSYSLTENLTGLGQQMYDYHANQLVGSIPPSVDIPLSFVADAGAVGFDGGIRHELMITNSPFNVPSTLYPDGSIYEIVTRHHHLTDQSEIGGVTLTGSASDGETILFTVNDLANGGTFSNNGTNLVTLDPSSSAILVGDEWEVHWRFTLSWLWDDVDQIDWTSRAVNLSGDGLAPAFAMTGGPGKSAVENDLQIDLFEVRDQFGRLVTINPNVDFFAEGGSDLHISGTVRFQDNQNIRPETDSYSVAVNFSGTEFPANSHSNGSFSLTLPLPNSVALATLTSRIVRVGPPSGAFGGEDKTHLTDVVGVFTDVEPPVAGQFQVLTSNGLLDANGHVWDPYTPLNLHLSVSDGQALGDNVTLHYWREGVDDTNSDGVADEDEYQTLSQPISQPGISVDQQIQFSNIDVSSLPANGHVSLFVSGSDWAGHPLDGSGSAGMDSDKATMVIGIDEDTILSETAFEIDTVNEYLLAGETHSVSMVLQDANGIDTIDEIKVYLASQSLAPVGEIQIDPREQTGFGVEGSFVTVDSVNLLELDEASSRLTIVFSIDWQFPSALRDNWLMPGIHVIDDTQTVANVNNIQALRWKLDNQLTPDVEMMHDLTEPLSPSMANRLYLGKGDIFALTGQVIYAGSGAPITTIPDGLQLRVMMVANGITTEVISDVTEANFNTSMEVPVGYPSTNTLPVTVDLLNVPPQGESLPADNITLAIDSTPPVAEFPPGVLTTIETDRLENVDVRVHVLESGAMSEEGVVIHWVYRRGGLNLPGSNSASTLDFDSLIGEEWVYSSKVNMTPPEEIVLQEGDQIVIWLSGRDMAGNELYGEGSEDNPRAPQLIVRIFTPIASKFEIDKTNPPLNSQVYIQATIRNDGTTMGDVNVTLVEELDDGTIQIYESHEIIGLAPQQKRVVGFYWEAWDSGKPDLYLMWDGDVNSLTAVQPQIDVQADDGDGGLFGSSSDLLIIIGLLLFLIVGVVIAVAAVMMKNRSEWDDEEEWDAAEELADKMLGTTTDVVAAASTTAATAVPSDAPLPEQAPPDAVSDEEWMAAAKAMLPDWPEDALLGYRNNGWTIEQLLEWKKNNQ